jgi:UDP-2-acetamido-3-amino-2,3-dideoxy-glucuronate N-acetyltransferase
LIHPSVFIHPLAHVEDGAEIGANTKVWQFATVRAGARVGAECILGQGAFVDEDTVLGDKCKLENYATVHRGSRLADEVFLGPGVTLCNDMWPRATTFEGSLKSEADWKCEPVFIERRASLGARAVVIPGVRIGDNAMIGAGTVVVTDVPSWGIVVGNPGRLLKVVPPAERAKL